MDKLKYVKLENPDGSYSNSIPLAVDSDYVDVNGSTLTNELNKKANSISVNEDIDDLQSQINSLSSGGPAGAYATVAALTSADPDHSKIYIVTENGHWYYYNSGWQDGGVYQSTSDHEDFVDLEDKFYYTNNVFDGQYRDDIFISPQSGSTAKIGSTDNHTIRAIELELQPNQDYYIITEKITDEPRRDRFRFVLSKDKFTGGTFQSSEHEMENVIINNNAYKCSFNSGEYKYLYGDISNQSYDAKTYIFTNCSSTYKESFESDLTQSYVKRNKTLYRTITPEELGPKDWVVTRQGRIEKSLTPDYYNGFCIPVKKGCDYEVFINESHNRFGATLTEEEFDGENPLSGINLVNKVESADKDVRHWVFDGITDSGYLYVTITGAGKTFTTDILIYEYDTSYKIFGKTLETNATDNQITVKNFGAKGDGFSDDTVALEDAMAYCYEHHIPVIFPKGTYLIRRPLTLRNDMEIYGINNPVIKKQIATTTTLTAALNENEETMTVASTLGFSIGDAITISSTADRHPAARHCSVGVITDIDNIENTITFKSSYDSLKVGAVKTHPVGCYVTNSCAIFRSWGMLYECKNVYIHDLVLDGQRQEGEFGDWQNGCIHIDATGGTVEGIPYTKAARDNTFRKLIIKNSPFDGISDQSQGGAIIEDCTITNSYMHGMHFGTAYDNASVIGNKISNCLASGVFWCQDVNNIIVQGNYISNCNKGCSDKEYGTAAYKSIITENVFKNITSYVFDFSLSGNDSKGNILISSNIIEDCKYPIANLPNRTKCAFTNNIVSNFSTIPSYLFDVTNSNKCTFALNIIPDVESELIIYKDNNLPAIDLGNTWTE